MQTKVTLSLEEIQIIIQCIENLNFPGKYVVPVGLLVDKLQKEYIKLNQDQQKSANHAKHGRIQRIQRKLRKEGGWQNIPLFQ